MLLIDYISCWFCQHASWDRLRVAAHCVRIPWMILATTWKPECLLSHHVHRTKEWKNGNNWTRWSSFAHRTSNRITMSTILVEVRKMNSFSSKRTCPLQRRAYMRPRQMLLSFHSYVDIDPTVGTTTPTSFCSSVSLPFWLFFGKSMDFASCFDSFSSPLSTVFVRAHSQLKDELRILSSRCSQSKGPPPDREANSFDDIHWIDLA